MLTPTDDLDRSWWTRALTSAKTTIRAVLRPDDWQQVAVLRVVLAVILAAVSGYYLTRWAYVNGVPWALAWTLPLALDVTAYKAVLVARRATDRAAYLRAMVLAWSCVLVSVAGNGAMHAVDFGDLQPTLWTVVATGMVFPVALVAGHIVTGGMAARPADPAPSRRSRHRRPAPDPATEPTPVVADPPAADVDEDDVILQGLITQWRRDNPRAGRRAMASYLAAQGRPISDPLARKLLPPYLPAPTPTTV